MTSQDFPINTDALWVNVSNREAKETIAKEIVGRASDGQTIGFGSGTTSMVCAIEFGKAAAAGLQISAVVTSLELEWLCMKLGVDVLEIGETPIDWCFDGADEVDAQGNLLKGRGGAMHRERLVFTAAAQRVVVADSSKDVALLGEKFPAPVEIEPVFAIDAMAALGSMGFDSVSLRTGQGKDGPVITESGNIIADVIYRDGFTNEVAEKISKIEGVVDTGLFMGFDFERLS
ncbi:MAG TPA: ribose 5-phosphate isomerase A [Acidimicrobiia bacterium]|nr:ribose 5-phosphate isomerase A [Acidimicrobiia bacterium]